MRKIVAVGVCPSGHAGGWADHAERSRRHISLSHLLEVVQRVPQSSPEVQINYQSIGSGGGIRQVTAGTVDFGASDMPMTDKQLQEAKELKILNIPTVLGADVPLTTFPA